MCTPGARPRARSTERRARRRPSLRGRLLTRPRAQALFHGATKEDLASKGWVTAQQKAFTKWMNVYLRQRKLRVANIFADLKDGVMLINLLEVISGKPLNRPWLQAPPTMRIKMVGWRACGVAWRERALTLAARMQLENLSAAFQFMTENGLHLTNAGPTDVCDGNEKIILVSSAAPWWRGRALS